MNDLAKVSRIVIIAGEQSGDALGGPLMAALQRLHAGDISFAGVGGALMEAQGLKSLFPLSDVAVMGPAAILKRLPTLIRRVYSAVDASIKFDPDVVVIIDSPEFTHPIAKRIAKRLPDVPIIDYVSPSVWAWRPGRAKRMTAYIDHVLALLPFEPDAHARLGGPACTYVGHSLAERIDDIRSINTSDLAARLGIDPALQVLTVLPGSRPSEVSRLLPIFGESLTMLVAQLGPLNVIIPAVASVREMIEEGIKDWPVKPHIVEGEGDKYASFALSDAALAASGTVTLELAITGTPMVVGYRIDALGGSLRWLVTVPSFVLPNLIVGRNAIPEFMQDECTPENLSQALFELLSDNAVREAQIEALDEARQRLSLDHGSPSELAAEIVLEHLAK